MASIVISHKYSHTRPDGLVIFQGTCFNTDFLPSPSLGPFLGNLDKVIPQLDIIDLVPKTLQAGTNYDGYVPDVNMYIIGASMGANTDSVGLLGDTQDSLWIVRAYTAVYTHIAPIGGVTIIPESPYVAPQRQTHYESPWGGTSGGTYWTPKAASMIWYGIATRWIHNVDPAYIWTYPAMLHVLHGMPMVTNNFTLHLSDFAHFSYSPAYGVYLQYTPETPPLSFYPDSDGRDWIEARGDYLRMWTPALGSQHEYQTCIGSVNRPVYWYPPYMPERDVSGGRNYGGGYPSLTGLSSDCYNWLINKWL